MKVDYKNDIESVLLSEEKLKEIVTSLGKQISDDYRDSGRKLLLVSVLKGSVVFMGRPYARHRYSVLYRLYVGIELWLGYFNKRRSQNNQGPRHKCC